MIKLYLLYPCFLLMFVLQTLNAQVFYTVDRMPFNSMANEMAPALYKGGVVFSSDRKNDIILVTVDQAGNFLYNLYFTEQNNNRSWTKPVLFPKDIVSRYNQSSASFSADGKTVFFTATQAGNEKLGDRLSDDTLKNGIFSATYNGEIWGNVTPFPYNNENFDMAHPHLSADGNRLFFSSRDPNGSGGYDIYFSDKINGRWSKPQNLGSDINTPESEVFPFLFGSNRLYFASNGRGGLGGLDLFYADYIDNEWKKAVPLPEPFNSKDDDFAFISNRRGNDDIYQFVSTFPVFTQCPEQIEEDFCYEFFESGTLNLDTTSLKYEWDLGDGTKIRDVRVQHCYKEAGYYLLQLNVIDTLTGEVSFNQATYDLNIERVVQPYLIFTDTVKVNEELLLDGSQSNITDFPMENYYWDFGDGVFGTEVKMEHRYNLPGEYIIRLGITGTNIQNNAGMQKACAHKKIVVLKAGD